MRQGVAHAVVAPGSRSTPLAVALARRPDLELHIFHDERSASFAALGIGLSTGVPAVLLCTSGTAAAHFHAAVVEAHQSNVPIIVCTADRPPELRDVGAPQTIDQANLFGTAVRWFHDPGVPAEEASESWRSLAARSMAAATGARPGPVHLNLPFREPLLGEVGAIPVPREPGWSVTARPRTVDADGLVEFAREVSGKTGVIVAGRGAGQEVVSLARSLGWPVFADSRSGLRSRAPGVVLAFDPILRSSVFTAKHVPSVVLRVGEAPASKVLAQWVARIGARVVQIQPNEMVIDPDHSVARTCIGEPDAICRALTSMVSSCDEDWVDSWSRAESAAQRAIDEWTGAVMSEPTVARHLTTALASGTNLVVSSSMPIRDVEWFGSATPGVTVHSNRGANGIDGVVSTAVGVALATGVATTLLIGDVACLHDSNGLLGLMSRRVDLTIVVTNNDGGSIFSFLPQASLVDGATFEALYGTPHGVSFEHLARAHGIPHVRVTDVEGLRAALAGEGTRVIEVPLDRSVNVAQHEALNAAIIDAVETA